MLWKNLNNFYEKLCRNKNLIFISRYRNTKTTSSRAKLWRVKYSLMFSRSNFHAVSQHFIAAFLLLLKGTNFRQSEWRNGGLASGQALRPWRITRFTEIMFMLNSHTIRMKLFLFIKKYFIQDLAQLLLTFKRNFSCGSVVCCGRCLYCDWGVIIVIYSALYQRKELVLARLFT